MKRKMTDKMMRKLNLSRKAMSNMKKHGGSMMGGVPMKRRDDMMMRRGGMSPSLEEQVRRRMLNQMASADRSMLEQRMLGVGSGRMRMGGQPSRAQMMKALQAKRMYGGSMPPMRKSVGLPGGPNEFPLPRKRRM